MPWWRMGVYGLVHWLGGATAALAVVMWHFGLGGAMFALAAATVGLAMVLCGMAATDVAIDRITFSEAIDESLRPPTL